MSKCFLLLKPVCYLLLIAPVLLSVHSNAQSPDSIIKFVPYDSLAPGKIQPGLDKDGTQLLKRLNGIVVQDNPRSTGTLQSLNLFGMGERYSQVLVNGSNLPSGDPTSRSFPLSFFPPEIIETVSIHKIGNPSLPGDFAGGTVAITTKKFPDRNFFYLLSGIGASDKTLGENFYGDKRSSLEWLSFPGTSRNLPVDFPTTRSQFSLSQKNPQEQVDLSKQLKNNLAPFFHGPSGLNHRLMLGFGRNYKMKKGEKIGFFAFVNHQKQERIEEMKAQAAPQVRDNPYPFANASKVLINSFSDNISYQYVSQLNAALNATIEFGRNTISLKSIFGNQVQNNFTERSRLSKPDEDSLAHVGMNYSTEQRRLMNIQLSGEHFLSDSGKLKLDWLASYVYYRQENPDERNFLLRQDPSNTSMYEIATPTAASLSAFDAQFTNSGRLWRDYSDHQFTGAVNLSFPFKLFHQKQLLKGGVYIQTRYRVLHSDLYFTRGPGFAAKDQLLAPDRYFPSGLSVTNFYEKYTTSSGIINPDALNATHRGNYTASANLGAGYLLFENKFSRRLSLDWGFRLESISQLVSTSQYNFFTGYKNSQLGTLDENDRVMYFELLPSASLSWLPIEKLRLHASYFKTINRPQLQELSRFRYYDAISFLVKSGNPLLANSTIHNFDGGIDWLFGKTSRISVSAFYKDIDQPIENIVSGYSSANLFITPHNAPPAKVQGLNVHLRLNLDWISEGLSHITVFGGGSFLHSEVDAGPIRSLGIPEVLKHDLSGTPDHSINGGLTIDYEKFPMLTILYCRTGDYISAVGSGRSFTLSNGNVVQAIPDYRVKGREQLDLQVSQKLFKSRFQVIAGINNLLNDPYTEYQDLNGNGKFDTPLSLTGHQGAGGFFAGGVDNTVMQIKSQKTWFVTVSYVF
jgi:TonB-dependent receptor